MLLKSFATLFVATLAVLSYTPAAEAHSWADCIDFKFKNPSKPDWRYGTCTGYARRYPPNARYGKLDEMYPNRHYQQTHKSPNTALPCSNRKAGAEPGADETRASPVTAAYGGKFGAMTKTKVGDKLCIRWPAKNHAGSRTTVQIALSKSRNSKDLTQAELIKNTIANLKFGNCSPGSSELRPCGGCFKVPVRASGIYLLQWRWELNKNEWYTSCADIQIGA